MGSASSPHTGISAVVLLGVTLSRLTKHEMVWLIETLVEHRRVVAWAYTICASSVARLAYIHMATDGATNSSSSSGASFFGFAVQWLQSHYTTNGNQFTGLGHMVQRCVAGLYPDMVLMCPLTPKTLLAFHTRRVFFPLGDTSVNWLLP